MRIMIADPRATILCGREMPLGIGNIAAFLHSRIPGLEISLHTDPHETADEIERRPPDIFMASHFSWNRNLSLLMMRLAKKARSSTVCVMGGPNISADAPRREAFLRNHPQVDFHVMGFYGEYPALRLVESLARHGLDPSAVKRDPDSIESAMYLHNGAYTLTEQLTKLETLDELPSPYAAGFMDKFFTQKLVPRIQGTRGCPFSCSFCRLGVQSYNRVVQLSVERFEKDLHLITERMIEHGYEDGLLRIADDNFGMPPLDRDKAQLIRRKHDSTGFPTMITTDTSKFVDDKAFATLGIIKDLLYVSNTSQSLNVETLKAIKRPNKGFAVFEATSQRLREAGFNTKTEVISGLPLESRQSFLAGLEALDRMGFSDVPVYQLTITSGAVMDEPDYIAKYAMRIKHRRFYGTSVTLRGETVEELDQVVVENSTMSEDDYHFLRMIGMLTRVLASMNAREVFDLVRERWGVSGVGLAEGLASRASNAKRGDSPALDLLLDFARDARLELIENRTESDRSDLPQNLVHHYMAMLLTKTFGDFCDLLLAVLLERADLPKQERALAELLFDHIKATDIRTLISRDGPVDSVLNAPRCLGLDTSALAPYSNKTHPVRPENLPRQWYSLGSDAREALASFLAHARRSDEERTWGYILTHNRLFKFQPEPGPARVCA
ncbi:MAG: radical SAM protein [Planctomycetota bacterium]